LVESLTPMYHHFEGTTTTVCALFLPNGYQVAIGMSACVVPADFNAEMGRKYSLLDAVKKAETKLWELEGYCLKKAID
uniref:Gp49 family protein n=1 Tax=Photobacterium halotolerans TaxID=265726 RepID=UPI0004819633